MSPTVLVADDSRTIRKVVEWALKGSAFEVVGVGSARETMDAAKRQPSVILLDYHMPDGSGYDVCRALKDGPTSQIPVVMLGGSYHDFDEQRAREAGADEVVMKPFKTDELIDAIDQVSSAAAEAAAASELAGQSPESSGPGAPPPQPSGGGASQPAVGSTQKPSGGAAADRGGAAQGTPAGGTPTGGSETPGSAPSRHPSSSGSGSGASKPRMRMDGGSSPTSPPPRRGGGSEGGSKPRMRTPSTGGSGASPSPTGGESGSDSRMPAGGGSRPGPGSQPRIPDAGSQPRTGSGSGSKASQPDINASTREQQVSSGSGASSAPATGGGDSGVSSIGASRAEIENMVNETVRKSVKQQLPGLLRNIMGEVFQKKVLPKLLEHGQQRVEALVQDELDERIRVCVREEIERLLAEE
ncbi:MAG: response regulator [Myxococcota bacterium]